MALLAALVIAASTAALGPGDAMVVLYSYSYSISKYTRGDSDGRAVLCEDEWQQTTFAKNTHTVTDRRETLHVTLHLSPSSARARPAARGACRDGERQIHRDT